ncbi:hypothetical protein B0T10DRAFT_565592 [Thelonectria olida]|uniref:Copper acquisition factor BIM1-like domain-containing protein n=1 Tax=Thelonectria olida TaxID=1576542 RepID=A0A9P8VYU6_9HYPO|nr:hypothetical protein B0T10DRAFT_565592 [Thelonectria olida]
MPAFKKTLANLALQALLVFAATDDSYSTDSADEMGPAAFMWPKDRVWSAAMDNTAPCGSVASPGNRSDFPMSSGKVALVDQYEGYSLQLSVSYLSNPTKNTDFSVILSSDELSEIDRGHTCVSVPDAASSVKAGQKATLQIKYTSDWEDNKNETYYACADIQYVALSDFSVSVPCFNATKTSSSSGSSSTSTSSGSKSTSSEASDGSSGGKPGSSLSKGAIAGIVVGSVCGVAVLVTLGTFVYRRRAHNQRVLQAMRDAWAKPVDATSV